MTTPNLPKASFNADTPNVGVSHVMFTVAEYGSYNFSPLYDTVLVLASPPSRLETKMTKSKTVTNTYGGIVEWHWPDDFDSVSGSMSTGGFLTKDGYLGHTTADRALRDRRTSVNYLKFQDFLALYQNNGSVFDDRGKPILRGQILMSFDRGIFSGHFSTFSVEEKDESPFAFSCEWDFKVERQLLKVPDYVTP